MAVMSYSPHSVGVSDQVCKFKMCHMLTSICLRAVQNLRVCHTECVSTGTDLKFGTLTMFNTYDWISHDKNKKRKLQKEKLHTQTSCVTSGWNLSESSGEAAWRLTEWKYCFAAAVRRIGSKPRDSCSRLSNSVVGKAWSSAVAGVGPKVTGLKELSEEDLTAVHDGSMCDCGFSGKMQKKKKNSEVFWLRCRRKARTFLSPCSVGGKRSPLTYQAAG